MACVAAEPLFVEGYRPGCIGRIVELHGSYYYRAWGVGAVFEMLMAQELCEFCEHYDAEHDLLLTASVGDRLIGSIAIQGSRDTTHTARLRWFIVEEGYHGRGIGRVLLERSLNFCRERGFHKVYLWTVDELPRSRHLYEKVGFCVVEQGIDSRYGTTLLSLKMELNLQ
ncbi:GNAT family N-acetyltransferase [Oscillatoria sp. FACHB-1407]|uniref:GNAT family N-acetyltransferase n=1 Tax=Oscillatoria sp. FACHB-1407 TaxID=2692847 RepID=UPI001681D0DE|nr:GNAT family N-acetyltransferase [Oscillatoria sp. FACHB-1407]MBD2465054.1 GNAT family N-acetyltransferase [Oscillatoria sp. FACHB-1407]